MRQEKDSKPAPDERTIKRAEKLMANRKQRRHAPAGRSESDSEDAMKTYDSRHITLMQKMLPLSNP
eukprot:scaffold662140_cov59-Prasinocladus_malaysianus.AAC.1